MPKNNLVRINNNLVFLFLLFIAVLAAYANTFRNEFAWDDQFFIVDNIHTRSLESLPDFFTEPSTGNLYRPMRGVFYTLTYKVWGLNELGYHLNAMLLHFLVTLTLFFITLKLTDKGLFSFVAALLFALHPIHTERVTNMTASFDIYGILFLLLSFLAYVIFSKSNKKHYYWLSIALYLFALFSSEEAITLTLLLFLYDLSFNYDFRIKNIKTLVKRYLPYIAVTILYLVIRLMVVQRIGRAEFYFEHSIFGTAIATIKVFAQYVMMLFLPSNLTIERYVKFETTVSSISFIISFIFLAVLIFFFIKAYKKSRIIFFSIGWFLITMLPFSNILPQYTIMAERYLYLASFGFAVFITFWIFKIKDIEPVKKYSKPIVAVLILLIASSYLAITVQRNMEWKDNFTLLSADLETNPYGTKINNALALHYRDKEDYERAVQYASKAIELASRNHNAYENLGTISAYKGNYDEAIKLYKKSIEISPDFYLAHNNLGLVYGYIGDFNSSIFYLKKAIELEPKLSKAHNDLGIAYANIGKFDEAIKEMKESIRLNPYESDYYYNLALIYGFNGDKDKARELLMKGLEIEPENQKIKDKLESLR